MREYWYQHRRLGSFRRGRVPEAAPPGRDAPDGRSFAGRYVVDGDSPLVRALLPAADPARAGLLPLSLRATARAGPGPAVHVRRAARDLSERAGRDWPH